MHDRLQQDHDETIARKPTEWEQRQRLVQAIMDSLMSILHRKSGSDGFALWDILRATDVTLDTIRARVAHQAFAGGPPETFWPSMCAVLDQFAPQLGLLVTEPLQWDPAYEAFWEPEVRALKALVEPERPPQAARPA
jgi:hypothetical protein